MSRGKSSYEGPSARSFYEALKLVIKKCVDEEIIQNVVKMYETSIGGGYSSGGGVLFKVIYETISNKGAWGKVRNELNVFMTLEHNIYVQLLREDFSAGVSSNYYFPIGDKRVQSKLNEAFRYWISNYNKYNLETLLNSYLDSLSYRHTDSPFLYMPSSLQWPNRVQGTTSSQFQTNYLSPSSFINPHSSYYSYR